MPNAGAGYCCCVAWCCGGCTVQQMNPRQVGQVCQPDQRDQLGFEHGHRDWKVESRRRTNLT